MGAKYFELDAAEHELHTRNVQGLIQMAKDDMKQDELEIKQAETDLKTLHEVKIALQAGGAIKLPPELRMLTGMLSDSKISNEEKIKSLNEQIHLFDNVKSRYKKEIDARQEEIKRMENQLSQQGGHRQMAAYFKNQALTNRRIAEEMRKA